MDTGAIPFSQPGFSASGPSGWTIPPTFRTPRGKNFALSSTVLVATPPLPPPRGHCTVQPHFYCSLNTYLGERDNVQITERRLTALWFGCSNELARCLKRVLDIREVGALVERGCFSTSVHCGNVCAVEDDPV